MNTDEQIDAVNLACDVLHKIVTNMGAERIDLEIRADGRVYIQIREVRSMYTTVHLRADVEHIGGKAPPGDWESPGCTLADYIGKFGKK